MKILAKKLEVRETRYPYNGMKRIHRETKFEVEANDSVDYLWIADSQIVSMESIDFDQQLYELEVDDDYLSIIIENQWEDAVSIKNNND